MTTTTAKQLITANGKVSPFGTYNPQLVAEQAALAEKLNQEARDNWDNEAWHRQVAADLASSLDVGFTFDNLFSSYIQTRAVGEFDRIRLRERRGLKVFYTSRGGYIEESQIRTEEWELPRDTLGFHVSEHIDKLRANFATTIADLVTLGGQKLDAEINRRIFSLLQEGAPAGSPYYVTAPTITKANLDAAIREVRDSVGNTGNSPVTIVGRASMVDQIADFDGLTPEANEEIRQRGRLGVYRGANVVQLTNYVDEEDNSYFPANELWVISGSVGEFVLYGGLIVKAWDENTVDYRHYRARRDIGGVVHHPERSRRLVATSTTP